MFLLSKLVFCDVDKDFVALKAYSEMTDQTISSYVTDRSNSFWLGQEAGGTGMLGGVIGFKDEK